MTECGHDVSEMARVWTRAEAVAQFKDLGQQRMAMLTCMTCMDTANRWPTWESSPVTVMQRECGRMPQWSRYACVQQDPTQANILERELRALEALVAAHAEEFREMVEGLGETGDLAARRAKRRYQQRTAKR